MVTWITLTGVGLAGLAGLTPPALTGHGGGPAPLEWGTGPLTVASLPRVVQVAHRGGAREVPENSMAGLTAAYARGTAQVLDLDTRMLGDGTLVVLHDATLDRTTDTHGPVRELRLADWRKVRVRPRAGFPGPGGRSGRRRSPRCWIVSAGGWC